MANYSPLFKNDKPHFHTSGGELAVGYGIYTYYAGTNTPVAMFSDPAGTTQYQNPIVLDSRGEPSGQGIYANVGNKYKVILKDPNGATVWSMDDVSPMGVGDITVEGMTRVEADGPNVHVTTSPDGQVATISVDGASFVSTQNTFEEVMAMVNEGLLPVLRYDFADGDLWYLFLREVDTDNSIIKFSGPTGSSGVFAYTELTSSGWATPGTYSLAAKDDLLMVSFSFKNDSFPNGKNIWDSIVAGHIPLLKRTQYYVTMEYYMVQYGSYGNERNVFFCSLMNNQRLRLRSTNGGTTWTWTESDMFDASLNSSSINAVQNKSLYDIIGDLQDRVTALET
jgi:hypothetical protein